MSYFNKIGGCGTVRAVWQKLKGDSRVVGKKRQHSDSDEEDEKREMNNNKKRRVSLNISGACDLINNIVLSGEDDDSYVQSEEEFNEGGLLYRLRKMNG